MVAAQQLPGAAAGELLVGAEITREVRAAELVVEGGGADRPFEHDRQRRSDARRAAIGTARQFPWLQEIGDVEVGHRETAQSGFRLRATAGGAFIADLAAGAGCRPGKR